MYITVGCDGKEITGPGGRLPLEDDIEKLGVWFTKQTTINSVMLFETNTSEKPIRIISIAERHLRGVLIDGHRDTLYITREFLNQNAVN